MDNDDSKRLAAALEALEAINNAIYAKGASLGSSEYFLIREKCCDVLYRKPEKK